MCSAGGEEQREDIITETMDKLKNCHYYFNDKYNKDKEDRLIDQSELQSNALIMRKELEEQMKEEGIEEECDANIHSSQNKFKTVADSLKREMKQYYNQQLML
ncbi:MAG: hypothetical protein EZS28_014878 [Streblomastix strix]|uniref:Uncharacterized protein n=1 Tax=Streblomastix strix TaxID=222440 RepID=A0A5J4W3N6_9EUKA|nr:MAG: hypothetical protein EZS28_014878 [Streblomastix strix]